MLGNNSSSFSIFFPMTSSVMEEGSSVVDCTLSLGTPSTRQTPRLLPAQPSAPSFCWDVISQSRSAPSTPLLPNAAANNNSNLGGDPQLLARRCANCDTTSTPLWRNGPRGPKSLCNACGIRYKKEERRAAASSSTAAAPTEAMGYSYQRPPQQQQQQSWGCYADEDMEVPYLSWRLNVVPPTTLFQYQ